MAQIIVITLLVLAFGWAIYRTFFNKGGCCGDCRGCCGCRPSPRQAENRCKKSGVTADRGRPARTTEKRL